MKDWYGFVNSSESGGGDMAFSTAFAPKFCSPA